MYKKTSRRILSAFLVLLMLVNTITPINVLAQETKEVQVQESSHVTSKTYYSNGLEINYQITSQWEGAFNGMITVQNVSEHTIRNWALQFDTPHEITNIWNGIIYEYKDYEYIIKNNGYNEQIPSGQTINFGLRHRWKEKSFSQTESNWCPQKKSYQKMHLQLNIRLQTNGIQVCA